MVMNRTIQVRMTRQQYERIESNAVLKGFSSLSTYMRYVALEHDFALYEKVSELHAFLLGKNPRKPKRRAGLPVL